MGEMTICPKSKEDAEIQDIQYDSICGRLAVPGPKTKYYANDDKSAIVIEQNGNRIELEPIQINRLPQLVKRWLKK